MTVQGARAATRVPHKIAKVLLAGCFLAGIAFSPEVAGSEDRLSRDLVLPKGVEIATLLFPPETTLPPGAAFDVDPDGLPAIADGSTIRVIGAPRQMIKLEFSDFYTKALEDDLAIRDFAWMRDGTLLFVIHDVLVTPGLLSEPPVMEYWSLDEVELPSVGMRIRPAGENSAYVFGATKEPGNYAVYLLSRNEAFAKLVALPVPIADVAGDGMTSLVAAGNTVLRVSENEVVRAVLRTREDIISIALTRAGGFFYASKSGIGYVAASGAAYEFMRGASGVLRVRGSSLYILMQEDSRVLRISPIDPFEQLLKGPN